MEQAPNISAHQVSTGRSRRQSRTVDIAAIESLERDDCIERWRQMFGQAPPKYTSLEFMRKALAYEVQVKAFGGHSNTVQWALKASLKAVQSEVETVTFPDGNGNARTSGATASYVKPDVAIERITPNARQTIQSHIGASDAYDQISITGRGSIKPIGVTKSNGKARADADANANKVTKSTRSLKPSKPSVLSIRAGTHLVREWNGRTYQVEALQKGFRLDGKTYRSLSAIAKKITGAHWSGPRFFGLES